MKQENDLTAVFLCIILQLVAYILYIINDEPQTVAARERQIQRGAGWWKASGCVK